MDAKKDSVESDVFEKHYDKLISAKQHIKELLPEFCSEGIISETIRDGPNAEEEAIKAIKTKIFKGEGTTFDTTITILKKGVDTKKIAEDMEKELVDYLNKQSEQATSPQSLGSKSQDSPASSQASPPAQQDPLPHTPSDQSRGLDDVGSQEQPTDPRLMDGGKLKIGFLSQHPALIKRLDTEALLPYLVAEGLITHDNSDSIRLEGVGSRKTDKLLALIHRRGFGNPSVYVRFLQLLSDKNITAGQLLESLVEDIKNDSLNDSIAQKFSNQADVSLQVHKGTIAASLNVDEVLHSLVAEGVVTILEKEKINAKKTPTAKAEQLVDSIQAGGSRAFEVFVKVLSSLESHEHLARLLESPESAANGDDEKNGMYIDSPASSQAPPPVQQDPLPYTPSDQFRELGADVGIQGLGTTTRPNEQQYAKSVSHFSELVSSHEGSQIVVPGFKKSVPPTAGSNLTKPEIEDLIKQTVTNMQLTRPVEQKVEGLIQQIEKLENQIAEKDSKIQDLDNELKEVTKEKDQLKEQLSNVTDELDIVKEREETQKDQLSEVRDELKLVKEREDSLTDQLRDVTDELERVKGRERDLWCKTKDTKKEKEELKKEIQSLQGQLFLERIEKPY